MGVISVKTPLILDHSLVHCSWRFLLPQKIKIESTWDILCTRGTICCPSEPEMIIHTLLSLIVFDELDAFITIGECVDVIHNTSQLSDCVATIFVVVINVVVQPN